MRLFGLIFALLLTLFAFGQGADRKIGPGDRIQLTCAEEPSLSKPYTVSADGQMMVTYIGLVRVAGLTLAEAGERISKRLVEDRVLRKATVTLGFIGAGGGSSSGGGTIPVPAKVVKVSGEVKNRADINWVEGMRLADIVKIAEPTTDADLKNLAILGAGGDSKVDYTLFNSATNLSNPLLNPGDTVRFPKISTPIVSNPSDPVQPITGQSLFVIGGVARPGLVPWKAGMTVRTAIAAAGGFSQRGDMSRVRLERRGIAPQNMDLTAQAIDAPVQANDQIIVEVTSAKRYLQVQGGVRSPGLVEYFDGITLTQALQAAGGVETGGKALEIRISAPDGGNRKVNYDDVVRGYRGEPILAPGDTIDVPGGPKPKPTVGGKKKNNTLLYLGGAALLWFIIGR